MLISEYDNLSMHQLGLSSNILISVSNDNILHTTTRKRQTVHVDRLVSCVSQQNTDMSSGNQAAPVPHPDEHQTTQYADNAVPSAPSTTLCLSSLGRDELFVLLFATVHKSIILSICSLYWFVGHHPFPLIISH